MVKINGKTYAGNNVIMTGNRIIIDGKDVTDVDTSDKEIHLHISGNDAVVNCDKSINVDGDVKGNVIAGDSVNCDDVGGNVEARSSVNCDDVKGNVIAGGSVCCDKVKGNVSTNGEVYRG